MFKMKFFGKKMRTRNLAGSRATKSEIQTVIVRNWETVDRLAAQGKNKIFNP